MCLCTSGWGFWLQLLQTLEDISIAIFNTYSWNQPSLCLTTCHGIASWCITKLQFGVHRLTIVEQPTIDRRSRHVKRVASVDAITQQIFIGIAEFFKIIGNHDRQISAHTVRNWLRAGGMCVRCPYVGPPLTLRRRQFIGDGIEWLTVHRPRLFTRHLYRAEFVHRWI